VSAALALLAVAGGSTLQRLTGMGFALVAAPALVLLLDPVEGVLVTNAGASLAALLLFVKLRGAVDWRRLTYLLPAALAGIAPGAWVALTVPAPVLDVVVGVAVIGGISASFVAARVGEMRGRGPMIGLGFASGFMNVSAGVGGPALSVYGVASRWAQVSFAATLQPLFLAMGVVSLAAKWWGGGADVATQPWWLWAGVAAAVVLGVVVGSRLAPRVSAGQARTLVIVIAYVGGVATLVRGVAALW